MSFILVSCWFPNFPFHASCANVKMLVACGWLKSRKLSLEECFTILSINRLIVWLIVRLVSLVDWRTAELIESLIVDWNNNNKTVEKYVYHNALSSRSTDKVLHVAFQHILVHWYQPGNKISREEILAKYLEIITLDKRII